MCKISTGGRESTRYCFVPSINDSLPEEETCTTSCRARFLSASSTVRVLSFWISRPRCCHVSTLTDGTDTGRRSVLLLRPPNILEIGVSTSWIYKSCIRIEKTNGWDSVALDRINESCLPGRGAEVAAVVCSEGTRSFQYKRSGSPKVQVMIRHSDILPSISTYDRHLTKARSPDSKKACRKLFGTWKGKLNCISFR